MFRELKTLPNKGMRVVYLFSVPEPVLWPACIMSPYRLFAVRSG